VLMVVVLALVVALFVVDVVVANVGRPKACPADVLDWVMPPEEVVVKLVETPDTPMARGLA